MGYWAELHTPPLSVLESILTKALTRKAFVQSLGRIVVKRQRCSKEIKTMGFQNDGVLLRFPSNTKENFCVFLRVENSIVFLFTFPSSSCHVRTKEIPRRNEGNLASERNLHRDARRYWFPGAYSTVNDGVLNFILISRSSLM